MTDYGHDLEFGVFVTPSSDNAAGVVELARLAERVGFDLVSFQDHPYQPRFLDTWTLLSFVAGRTTRIRLTPNVMNLPLRPPAVTARSVASLDRLSGGRVELGIGAGGFWDAIVAMGGRRLTPGQSVDALEEAIDVIRLLWDTGSPGRATFAGRYYELHGAAPGPGPLHDVGIWIGAYKPRMLDLVGRKGDGWLPSLPYLQPGALASGNQAIDEAAEAAGRRPADVRRLLNIGAGSSSHPAFDGPPATWVEEMTRMAVEDGISTFIVMGDDAGIIESFAGEVMPAVREEVASLRRRETAPDLATAELPRASVSPPVRLRDGHPATAASEYERLGIRPTPDDGARRSSTVPWDEAARPHRPPSGPEVTYTARGRLTGQHLIDVHDSLRTELTELQDVLAQVVAGALTAGNARAALHEMALRQNDWTLGAFCIRYCSLVAGHHGVEDQSVFPHLATADPALEPVIPRLMEEHRVIHEAIEAVDHALVRHITNPDDGFSTISSAIDYLSDALLSHLAYEEQELVEPLARVGFF